MQTISLDTTAQKKPAPFKFIADDACHCDGRDGLVPPSGDGGGMNSAVLGQLVLAVMRVRFLALVPGGTGRLRRR